MAATKNKGLGKGLGALLGSETIPNNEGRTVLDLNVQDVSPNENQPRKHFDREKLKELAASIQENGVIQPIIVSKVGVGYQIVAGERRWRAARLANAKTIPAIVKELTDLEILQQALIENVQRQDLNAIETGEALQRLMDEHGMTQEKLSAVVGMSRSALANTLRLQQLTAKVKKYVISEELSPGHARALLALPEKKTQDELAAWIVEKELSVRETERLVKKTLEAPVAVEIDSSAEEDDAYTLSIQTVEETLTRNLGTKVRLRDNREKKKGQIVIDYYSLDDLERIMDILGAEDESYDRM